MVATEHYFSQSPAGEANLRPLHVSLAGRDWQLTTASGIFSPDRIDIGTRVLLAKTPPPPAQGDLLDIGCGWGAVALSLALESPEARVWAVDVNERALDLVRRNAEAIGARNVTAVRPEDVPDDIRFAAIRSNPPIRVGKQELHGILDHWLPRLMPGAEAWLVVARDLGADSLMRWLQERFAGDLTVERAANDKGFRVLRAIRS